LFAQAAVHRFAALRAGGGDTAKSIISLMISESHTKLWPLIPSIVYEFWAIIEPHIEEAAIQLNIPIELYYYSELGLDSFSIEEFQKRDPFSNPMQFEKAFVTLNVKGWIEPLPDGRYNVTQMARDGARKLIQSGDQYLRDFESFTDIDLHRLAALLKQLVLANTVAPQPPEKWAIYKRFHMADKNSPAIIQLREYLMDLFAYRDDSHISASHPHFGRGGIVWSVLGSLWKGDALTAEKMAESMSFRGYEVNDYIVALKAATRLGWVVGNDISGKFQLTDQGRQLREHAEQLTNAYFYAPWSVMTQDELDELYDVLLKLRDQLITFRKVK
jgi:hypothetical protein